MANNQAVHPGAGTKVAALQPLPAPDADRRQSGFAEGLSGRRPVAAGYLFLPSALRRAKFLVWLRRTHAWLGLWGAALALLFGATGFLLNHRMILKIPAAKVEQTVIQLPLPEPHPANAQALAQWLQGQLAVGKPPLLIKIEPEQTVTWNGETLRQPQLWRAYFATPQRAFNAEYWAGNAFVTVKRQDPNLFSLLTRLHTGNGVNAAWVLLVDTLAGGLIALALTGTLLWSRLHGTRLAAAALACGSLSLAVWFAWASL